MAFKENIYKLESTHAMQRAVKYKEHNCYFIYGKQGTGKTTYAMLMAYSYYRSWKKVLQHMVFKKEEAAQLISKCFDADGKIIYRIPILIWDDFTFENKKSRKYDRTVEEFSGLLGVIRTIVSNFIATGSSFKSMPQAYKDYPWQVIRITRPRFERAKAYFYEWNISPRKEYFRRKIDPFTMQYLSESFRFNWIPPEIIKEKERIRDSYSYQGFQRWNEAILYEKELEKIDMERAREMKRNKAKAHNQIEKRENYK